MQPPTSWFGRVRGSSRAATVVMVMLSLMTATPAHSQDSSAGGSDHLRDGQGNNTGSRSRVLYHVDVTEDGEPCVRNELLDRTVNPASYEFGCRDIEVRKLWPATSTTPATDVLIPPTREEE